MTATASINDQEFTVTPATRLEALATHRAALRYTGSAIIAAAFAVLGTGYAAISPSISAPAGGTPGAVAVLALALSLLALAVGVLAHRRLQTLQRDPDAWTAPTTLGQGGAPAPWRAVLRVPRKAVLGAVGVALLWAVGILLMRSSAAPAQMIGGAAVIPGAVLLLLVNVTCAWVVFSAFIYMLWSLVPKSAAPGTP